MDDSQLAEVRTTLTSGEQLRADVPGGWVHIDRRLPFLLVYRRPAGVPDAATADLVTGEASYLVIDGDHSRHPAVDSSGPDQIFRPQATSGLLRIASSRSRL